MPALSNHSYEADRRIVWRALAVQELNQEEREKMIDCLERLMLGGVSRTEDAIQELLTCPPNSTKFNGNLTYNPTLTAPTSAPIHATPLLSPMLDASTAISREQSPARRLFVPPYPDGGETRAKGGLQWQAGNPMDSSSAGTCNAEDGSAAAHEEVIMKSSAGPITNYTLATPSTMSSSLPSDLSFMPNPSPSAFDRLLLGRASKFMTGVYDRSTSDDSIWSSTPPTLLGVPIRTYFPPMRSRNEASVPLLSPVKEEEGGEWNAGVDVVSMGDARFMSDLDDF